MKQLVAILLFAAFLSGLSSCYNTSVQKPEKLIPKDEFVKMMVDIYLIQVINNGEQNVKTLKKITPTDLYYSVLKKYSVPDTVFIRSLQYYSSFPREYEKMHLQIINILDESQQLYKPKDKLKTETE